MATAEEAATWIALESDDYDGSGGSNGYGWARASTEDVARGLHVAPAEAFRLLKAAKRKKLVTQVEGMRKKLGRETGRHNEHEVGWALWEVHLDEAQTRARDPEHESLTPNSSSSLEWVKGSGVDRDGHNLTWWKNKAAKWSRSEHDRPRVFIQVRTFDRAGQPVRGKDEFPPEALKEAKACARERAEAGLSAYVEGRVEIPYQSNVTIEIGEWRNSASNGYYVWSVDGKTQMPVTRRGPFADYEEGLALAKAAVRGGGTYDEVITFGGDPEAGDFEVVKAFKAWSGEVHYASDLPRVGGRLREYR